MPQAITRTALGTMPNPLVQSIVSIVLGSLILSAWFVGHIHGVFLYRWSASSCWTAPVLGAIQCWLSVGVFIVAHDAIHGSFCPIYRPLNRFVAQLCLFVYAGFSYDPIRESHLAHHRYTGTALDPDFSIEYPDDFWRWYRVFFERYFGLRQVATLSTVVIAYTLIGADIRNLLALWALPAILSSIQLFYFGTYEPHKHEGGSDEFSDRHRARSADRGWLMSLITCFHFGFHHEHHEHTQVPWWKLPFVKPGETL